MDAIEFTKNYTKYVRDIEEVVKSDYSDIINEMLDTQPEDIITPDTYFPTSTAAMGLVWKIFLEKVKNEARKSDCPKCHSKKVAEIFYGLIPSEFAQKIIGDGDMLGGCIISPNSPKWRCKSCKHEWGNVK